MVPEGKKKFKDTIKLKMKDTDSFVTYEIVSLAKYTKLSSLGHYVTYIKTKKRKWIEINDSIKNE